MAQAQPTERTPIAERLLTRVPRCSDHLARRIAAEHLPEIAARWGAPIPIVTGRAIGDYRDTARRLVVPAERRGGAGPELVIETDRGDITVSLFPADAPISVDAFLTLVTRNFFLGSYWNRVVPNFVLQGGDPRGDGWGGPGYTLRDELNRRRYDRGTVGVALSGPDTGGSQFFIALSAQPQLDGAYTAIGRVTAGLDLLNSVLPGDRIRRVRRR